MGMGMGMGVGTQCRALILRAQQKLSKGRPNTRPKSCSVITDPQVWCENHM